MDVCHRHVRVSAYCIYLFLLALQMLGEFTKMATVAVRNVGHAMHLVLDYTLSDCQLSK